MGLSAASLSHATISGVRFARELDVAILKRLAKSAMVVSDNVLCREGAAGKGRQVSSAGSTPIEIDGAKASRSRQNIRFYDAASTVQHAKPPWASRNSCLPPKAVSA